MEKEFIEDEEILYRVVKKSYPDGFINGEPSAALFMDVGGVSVERDGERDEKAIIKALTLRFKRHDEYNGAVKITAEQCRNVETFPVPYGNKKNEYHAEIWNSEDSANKLIGLNKAMQLASLCQVVQEAM